jgi:hypothetical protein
MRSIFAKVLTLRGPIISGVIESSRNHRQCPQASLGKASKKTSRLLCPTIVARLHLVEKESHRIQMKPIAAEEKDGWRARPSLP